MPRIIAYVALGFSWLLNAASLAGYFLLRRQITAPQSSSNQLRLHIIRPYRTETDDQGRIVSGSETDELELMARLFATAQEYGNAHVVVVANLGDLGLAKIRRLAEPYSGIVQVIEAPAMPSDTVSGQLFNHKIGWEALQADAKDEDILITTDCDSDLTLKLLRQVVKAFEDSGVGGVGSFTLYQPAVNLAAAPFTMAFVVGMGFMALDGTLRGYSIMPGNLISMRVGVFREFGGYDQFSRIEQLVDDVSTSARVLTTGAKLVQVGGISVYNRYSTLRGWWQRWTRQMLSAKLATKPMYYFSPLPTYGAQVLTELLLVRGIIGRRPLYAIPFALNWSINILYGGLTGAWRDALITPVTSLLNMGGWIYVLVNPGNEIKWRGIAFKVKEK